MHKREKGCPYRFTSSESERERERAMREEAELASPAAAIVAKKEINQTGNGAPDIVCI